MLVISIITMAHLRTVDLNLLVILDALLEERSVTRAAQRLGMSQPAVSRALARLRNLFSDPLLVEGRDGYVPTPRAVAVRPLLQSALAEVERMLESRPYDPSSATGKFRLFVTDLHAAVLIPRLIARLDAEAPGVDLDVLPVGPQVMQALEDGAVDAAIGLSAGAPAEIRRRTLFQEGFCTLMRPGHPAANDLTLDRYMRAGHIVVNIGSPQTAPVDAVLGGGKRRIRVRAPSFLAAVEIAAQSDLMLTLPVSLTRTLAVSGRLVALPSPVKLAPISMDLFWHARFQNEPRHVWLRSLVVDVATAYGASLLTPA